MNQDQREALLAEHNVNSNRVTPALIEASIVATQYHVFPGTMLTVCCLTLKNGFNIVGSAACADPSNFREEVGRQFSRADAKSKIGAFLGYELKSKLAAAA